MKLKPILGAAAIGLSLINMPAMGIGFNDPFQFDATGFGGGVTPLVRFIDFSYNAEVDQDASGNFQETGGGFFASFRETLAAPPIPNGLGTAYNMYALFTATGTAVNTGLGGVDATFHTFDVTIYIDPNLDTTLSFPPVGVPPAGASTTVNGNSDDFSILTGQLLTGGAHVFPGLINGDFDATFDITSFDSTVWKGPAFQSPLVRGDFNGVNTNIAGFQPVGTSFINARITGSGNTSFVPEPATLLLMGIGLLSLSGIRRLSAS